MTSASGNARRRLHPLRGFQRRVYETGRPDRAAKLLNRIAERLFSIGLAPRNWMTLEVTGRRSGRIVSFPVVVTDFAGQRYVVSMLGEGVNWVRNARAAQGHVTLRHRRREAVQLEEVVDSEARAPVIKRYLALAPGARPHIPVDRHAPLAEFARVAPRIPVFRVVSERPDRGAGPD